MIRHGLAALLVLTSATVAHAAEPDLPPSDPPEALEPLPPPDDPSATSPPPIVQSEDEAQSKALDALFAQLAKADDPQFAKRIASAVQALWQRSGSDTIDLLMARSTEAQRKSKIGIAIRLMDEVVSLRPDYAEGWNRRATLHYMAKDYDDAMADIRETLNREPRHYGAWLGLGRILKDADLDAKALAAFRHVLAIYPQIEGLKREVDELALKVEGQPI